MSIKIKSFGGPLVWILRKYRSDITSNIMLTFAAKKYSEAINWYIAYFMNAETVPLFQNVMIETINRCNGICDFCPANRNHEQRPYKKMDTNMYYMVIQELKKLSWQGKLFLCVNNEPFLDNRIVDFAIYAKGQLKNVKIVFITNGTLLNTETVEAIIGSVDELIINDYSEQYRLSPNIKSIYKHFKKNMAPKKISITINRRYNKEILANRAGAAPNKLQKNNHVTTPCIYPFTDLIIFPDGKVGMCCNDCNENSSYGDITKNSLFDIWQNNKFKDLRKNMAEGRNHHFLCKKCDVIDAGERERFIKELQHRQSDK